METDTQNKVDVSVFRQFRRLSGEELKWILPRPVVMGRGWVEVTRRWIQDTPVANKEVKNERWMCLSRTYGRIDDT